MTLKTILMFIPILVLILLSLNKLLATSNPEQEKISLYESGFEPMGGSRGKFSLAFYMVAILFLIFDLELLTVFPLAACVSSVQMYGFIIGIVFLTVLTLGFVFEYGSKVLDFTSDD